MAEILLWSALPVAPEHSSEILHLLGLAVAGGGPADDAITLLRRAVISDRDQPIYRVALVALAAENGRPLEAEREYKLALSIDPMLVEAHFNLADLLTETRRPDDAVCSYLGALAVQPDLVEARFNLGSVRDEPGRHEEAAKAMQRSCELAPELFDEEIQTRHQ